MRERVILVADDSDDACVIVAAVLTRQGFRVIVAQNGQVAVEQARRLGPDLILMDLEMPIIDGWRATKALQSDPLTASIPVLAFTSHDPPQDELRAWGFRALLRKPISCAQVLHAVTVCLERGDGDQDWVELHFAEGEQR